MSREAHPIIFYANQVATDAVGVEQGNAYQIGLAFLDVTIAGTATLKVDGKGQQNVYRDLLWTNTLTGVAATDITASGFYVARIFGLTTLRGRVTAWSSGGVWAAGYTGDYEAAAAAAAGSGGVLLGAGESHLGSVTGAGDIVTVTPVLDTSAYASGDLLADVVAFVGARVAGGRSILQSITVVDEDDQKVAFTAVFASANGTFGTFNVAPSISDAAAREVLGSVDVGVGDYKDLGGVSVASVKGIGLALEAGAGVTTVWMALVNGTGTPTFTASGLKLRLGLLYID